MSRRRIRWTLVVSLLALVPLSASLVRALVSPPDLAPNEADREHAARVLSPSERTLLGPPREGHWIGGNGRVEPRSGTLELGASVPGRIAAVLVNEGERVSAGAVLAELDHAAEDAALAIAEAELESARAELSRALRGHHEVRASSASAEAAMARASRSEDALARAAAVRTGGGVSEQELARAEREAQIDRALAEQASAQHALARGARRDAIAIAQAGVHAATARRDRARAEREQRFVRSPIDAEVLQIRAELGEHHQPGGVLVVVGETRGLRVRMEIDERDVGRVDVGREARVYAPGLPDVVALGRVTAIGRRMGAPRQTSDDPSEPRDREVLEALIELVDPPGLFPGQRVRAFVAAGR